MSKINSTIGNDLSSLEIENSSCYAHDGHTKSKIVSHVARKRISDTLEVIERLTQNIVIQFLIKLLSV